MEYSQLNDAQRGEIHRQKLAQIEVEHYRLTLDLKLAAAVGVENEQVTRGRTDLALLEGQHQALVDLIFPSASTDGGGNGLVRQGTVPVTS
jgi:DNA-binding XRE family transcriptional regulator